MCGIAGFIHFNGTDTPSSLMKMTHLLQSRGPDDAGFFGMSPQGTEHHWKNENEAFDSPLFLGMGFRRLSILDLTATGSQPMQTASGDKGLLTFNGQIYNYIELRKEIGSEPLRSTGDTEVLLRLLQKYGMAALARLNGMFAFAYFDVKRRELFLVRDPVGIKPLYFTRNAEGIYWASEIKSLLAVCPERRRLNHKMLGRYLMNNWLPEPDTLFEGIFKLEPGHYLKVNQNGQIENRRFWDFEHFPDPSVSFEDWQERLDQEIDRAVTRQLRSDVPIGFFLSGGVDSSLLAVKAKKQRQTQDTVSTFTIGFKWSQSAQDMLDVKSARILKDRFGFDHHEILLEPSVVSLLPKIIEALEEPVADPAALCSYLICEQAKGKFKVLFSGQGADEVFGGYPVYQAGWLAGKISKSGTLTKKAIQFLGNGLPYAVGGKRFQTVHRLRKVMHSSKVSWPENFLLLRSPMREAEMLDLIQPSLHPTLSLAFGRHREIFSHAIDWDLIHQMMYLDAKTYLPALNLFYSDKTSMAHSIELRVPFLDLEVIQLMGKVPSKFSVNLFESKILLKAVAERHLPHEIVYRKKSGFGLPLRDWFVDELQPFARELLSPDRLKRQGIFSPELPHRWLDEHRSLAHDHCMKLYSMVSLQLWLERFGLS